MRLTDEIAAYIYRILEQAEDGYAELQRNELAERLGCVPSQINYVLTSRFTPEQGYLVESRRGGGGYIRVRRIQFGREAALLMHLVNSIGEELSA
ncbi:MAG: CtsR family transcriptional regulator, partial [Clostridiales bacterium]|nr:CtsR family transcriptional regulator [Clostridiales bacterium]